MCVDSASGNPCGGYNIRASERAADISREHDRFILRYRRVTNLFFTLLFFPFARSDRIAAILLALWVFLIGLSQKLTPIVIVRPELSAPRLDATRAQAEREQQGGKERGGDVNNFFHRFPPFGRGCASSLPSRSHFLQFLPCLPIYMRQQNRRCLRRLLRSSSSL